jgi:hypothetical protein
MGNFGLGALGKAGFATHLNAWDTTDTGVALSTGDMIEMLPTGFPNEKTTSDPNVAIHGTGLQAREVVTTKAIDGPINCYLNFYSAVSRIMACLFGTEATSVLTSAQSWSHLMTTNEENTAIHGTLAATDNLVARDIMHCKPESAQLVFEQGKIAMGTFGMLGKQMVIDDSGANTLAGLDANLTMLAQPTNKYLLLSSAQPSFRINAFSGGALGAGDALYPSKVTVNLARSYARRYTAQNGQFIDEPKGGAWREIGLTAEFTDWTDSTHWTWIEDMTSLKCDLSFTSPDSIGASSDKYKWLFEFPEMQIKGDVPDLNDPDLLKVTFPLIAKEAPSNPTGMAFTAPRLTIQDAASADHLTNGV